MGIKTRSNLWVIYPLKPQLQEFKCRFQEIRLSLPLTWSLNPSGFIVPYEHPLSMHFRRNKAWHLPSLFTPIMLVPCSEFLSYELVSTLGIHSCACTHSAHICWSQARLLPPILLLVSSGSLNLFRFKASVFFHNEEQHSFQNQNRQKY